MRLYPQAQCRSAARTAMYIFSIVASLVVPLSYCQAQEVQQDEQAIIQESTEQQPLPPIAPLFTHGTGLGILGLEDNDAPAFLSEDEARDTIISEARIGGVFFAAMPQQPGATVDATDQKRRLSFVFVSREDANSWRSKSTDQGLGEVIDIFGCAITLRAKLVEQGSDGCTVVFYDPATTISDVLPQLNQSEYYTHDLYHDAHELARRELRFQVRDYIEWLKAEHLL